MEAVLERARQQGTAALRLVQAAYHSRSLSLYTKLGFAALPISTRIMLRAIACIVQSEGEDLSDLETAPACMQVFALGGRSGSEHLHETPAPKGRPFIAGVITQSRPPRNGPRPSCLVHWRRAAGAQPLPGGSQAEPRRAAGVSDATNDVPQSRHFTGQCEPTNFQSRPTFSASLFRSMSRHFWHVGHQPPAPIPSEIIA
jgi:hypothetical protein